MSKTAVQLMIDWLNEMSYEGRIMIRDECIFDKLSELKDNEEAKQIKDSWLAGVSSWDAETDEQEYYNETFNQNKDDDTSNINSSNTNSIPSV